MGYQIKPPLWGIKPGKRETRQQVITGANVVKNESIEPIYPYVYTSPKRQIVDSANRTFVSPSTLVRDFKPFAKELINTGTVVLDTSKGRMFMWNLPPFSFEINQEAYWDVTGCSAYPLKANVSGYDVLISPYIYTTGDVTRLSLNAESNRLYLRLSYAVFNYSLYQVFWGRTFSRCQETNLRDLTADTIATLQQSVNYSDWSATNCTLELTLSKLLGVETWGDYKNGFYIQYGGGNLVSSAYHFSGAASQWSCYKYSIFREGTAAILARVFLPELFAPVVDRPAILKSSAPIISGCIVRFVKNGV